MASSAAITGVSVIAAAAPAHASAAGGAQVHARVPHELARMVSDKVVSSKKAMHRSGTTVAVIAGDTLSGIARAHCGNGARWRSIFNANRSTVKDPDLIYPGQVLVLDCSSAQLSSSVRVASDRFDGKKGPCGDGDHDGFDAQCWEVGLAPMPGHHHVSQVVRHASGKIWGVTYGHPNFCGDGDGDGWDVNCQARTASPPVRHHAITIVPVAFSSSGTYSFSALENLWVSAGGNPGAEATAACIAEHESGGNPNAISPTNDYGLWQINGSHGALATLSPSGNARAAVLISGNGTNWSPWTTAPMCGV